MTGASADTDWLVLAIEESIAAQRTMQQDAQLLVGVADAAVRIVGALAGGCKVILLGNGGSAADASHLAAEFVGRFVRERRALPAISLADNAAALSAIGNDFGFEAVFERGLEAFAQRGDIVIALSTSGASPNVIRALRRSRDLGLYSIAFTGPAGAACGAVADLWLRTPATATARIQECYMLLCHAMCDRVDALVART